MFTRSSLLLQLILTAPLAAPLHAQSGIPDQEQPHAGTSFFTNNSIFVFQQQVRAGLTGRLEGFDIYVLADATGQLNLRIRRGDGWNTNPTVWTGSLVGPSDPTVPVFIDVSSADLQFAAGETFVIEYQGTDTFAFLHGNNPSSSGLPCYSEPCFVNTQQVPQCVAFRTFVLPDTPVSYCAGDGTATPCPCGNPGGPGEGCANGTGSGAELSASGSASVSGDSLQLEAGNSPPGQPGLFFQGNNAINGGDGVQFGDGLRCAGMNVVRLEIVTADGTGSASSTVPIAASGGVFPGDTKYYQWWYRDPTGSPCGNGFNLSNGLEVTWAP